MQRYFFHVEDDTTTLDEMGTECPDLAAARDEAVRTSGEILRDGAASHLWSGKPWRMWVTQADGGGKTLFTLTFHATHGDGQP
jgi:hypothetical protein